MICEYGPCDRPTPAPRRPSCPSRRFCSVLCRNRATAEKKRTIAADLSGQRFGRWVVEACVQDGSPGRIHWWCICDCGTRKMVAQPSLRRGISKSCGCLIVDTHRTHGQTKQSEFRIWDQMKQRCLNPKHKNYSYYGGRGIRIHEDWLRSFVAFLEAVGSRPSTRHSLDRINVNGNYEPGNVRWATKKEQGRNIRRNRLVTANDKTQTLADWADETGLPYNTIYSRLRLGWSDDRIVNEPQKIRKSPAR